MLRYCKYISSGRFSDKHFSTRKINNKPLSERQNIFNQKSKVNLDLNKCYPNKKCFNYFDIFLTLEEKCT